MRLPAPGLHRRRRAADPGIQRPRPGARWRPLRPARSATSRRPCDRVAGAGAGMRRLEVETSLAAGDRGLARGARRGRRHSPWLHHLAPTGRGGGGTPPLPCSPSQATHRRRPPRRRDSLPHCPSQRGSPQAGARMRPRLCGRSAVCGGSDQRSARHGRAAPPPSAPRQCIRNMRPRMGSRRDAPRRDADRQAVKYDPRRRAP